MGEEGMSAGQKGGWLAGLATAMIVAIVASGSKPWWLGGEGKPENKPAPIVEGTQTGTKPVPPAEQIPVPAVHEEGLVQAKQVEITPEYFVGRWRVEQDNGQATAITTANYYANGRFDSTGMAVQGYMGARQQETGNWHFQKISSKTFHLSLTMDNGQFWNGTFKVIDHDHVQNIDQNYVAERVE